MIGFRIKDNVGNSQTLRLDATNLVKHLGGGFDCYERL